MNDFQTEPIEDLIILKLGLKLGDKFTSFKDWQAKLDETSKANFLRFWKRDSLTIETAKRKVKRPLNSDLEFYHVKYSCFFAKRLRTGSTLAKRKNRSIGPQRDSPCPALITIRATEDGDFLEIYNIIEQHNHPVNAHDYQKLILKKTILDSYGDGERYKLVVKKCKHISRIAALSSPARLLEMIKSLDDYVFYLKSTTSEEEMDRVRQEKINNNLEIDKTVASDENIEIIVEDSNDS